MVLTHFVCNSLEDFLDIEGRRPEAHSWATNTITEAFVPVVSASLSPICQSGCCIPALLSSTPCLAPPVVSVVSNDGKTLMVCFAVCVSDIGLTQEPTILAASPSTIAIACEHSKHWLDCFAHYYYSAR